MLVLAALLAGVAAGTAAVAGRRLMRAPPAALIGSNFRSADLPVIGGVVILLADLASEAAFALAAVWRPPAAGTGPLGTGALATAFLSTDHLGIALAALGFFAIGLLDDAAGGGGPRGLRGHFGALRHGVLSAGAVKALGGALIGFVAAALWELRLGEALLDAVLVAALANLMNLLDLRPGRACKVFLLLWAPLAAAAWTRPFVAVSAPVAAAAAVWLPADLKERAMLGDAGSNLLGAVLGAGLALVLPTPAKIAAAVLVVALTAASERWSFSSAIRRVPPLDWLDRLGRSPE